MASDVNDRPHRKLLFPVGALIFSAGIDRLIHEGRLDPLPYVQRHMRGDWGDVADHTWRANNTALTADERLESFHVITRELSIRVFTEADRSATYVVLPIED